MSCSASVDCRACREFTESRRQNRRTLGRGWRLPPNLGLDVSEQSQSRDSVDTVAAEWMVRLESGELTEQERNCLSCWLEESPLHRLALRDARAAWARMDGLRLSPGALALDLVPPPRAAIGRRIYAAGWPAAGGALAACLALVLWCGLLFWLDGRPLAVLTADYRTGTGELRDFALADGSRVHLGPDSAVTVRYSATARRVELLAGLAHFTVAPMGAGEDRPFVVAAANGTARALGTRFSVRHLPHSIEVSVAEHDVEVALETSGSGPSRIALSAGRSVRYSADGLAPGRAVDTALAMAWREGRLVFDHVPLAEVVAELNRYRRGRIVVADGALATRAVSGVFHAADPDGALATIGQVLNAHSTSIPSLLTVLY